METVSKGKIPKMKRILLIGIFALVLSAMVFAVVITTPIGTYDSETGNATITLKPGWNIVPTGSNEVTQGNCNIKAAWIWISTAGKYIGGSPESGGMSQEDSLLITNAEEEGFLFAQVKSGKFVGGMWVYTTNQCQVQKTFSTSEPSDGELNVVKLAKGWNFVAISPWMGGKKISEFLGECTLSKITAWDVTMQRWGTGASSTTYMSEMAQKINNGEDEPLQEAMSGIVFLFKVPNECRLGLSGGIEPPVLPD